MRLPWALLVGGVFVSGVAAGPEPHLHERQQATAPSATGPASSSAGGGDGSSGSSSSANGGGSSTGGGEGDVTITQVVTVTNGGDVDTVTRMTTDFTSTTTNVITSTKTVFDTATVTSSNADVATKTKYVTSTVFSTNNAKRNFQPRTIAPAQVSAAVVARVAPTDFPGVTFFETDENLQKKAIEKRATFTEVDTVTVDGSGGATTVVRTDRVVSTKFSTTTRTITNTITETDQVNAKSTKTITSTLTITSASGGPSSTGDSSGDDSGNSSSSSGGLSTGAKAGIGAGVGVAGLIVIAFAIWFLIRRHRRKPKPIHDDVIGHSEVPIGPSGGGRSPTVPSMSQASSGGGLLAAGGHNSLKSSSTAEGYRGTAAGDGRAGYAKPQPYGAAYKQPGLGYGQGHSPPPPSTSPNYAGARSETLRSQTESHAGSVEMDAVGQQGSYRAPEGNAVEMGYDEARTGYRPPQAGANEMDSGMAAADNKKSSPIYEMPAANF